MPESTRKAHSLIVGFVLVLFLCLFSCGKSGEPVGSGTPEPRSLWARHATQTYIIEQARSCFCPGSYGFVRLTVVNNKIVKGTDSNSNYTLTIAELKRYKTINELFEFVEWAEECEPDILQVEYDPIFGYPRNVFVDSHLDMTDEQIGFDTRLVKLFP